MHAIITVDQKINQWENLSKVHLDGRIHVCCCFLNFDTHLRWFGTVVTSHTQPHSGKHTPQSWPCFKKLYKVLTAPHAINRQTHYCHNVVCRKCSLYVVSQIKCRILQKVGLQGWKCDSIPWCAKTNLVTCDCFRWFLSIVHKLSWDKKLQKCVVLKVVKIAA